MLGTAIFCMDSFTQSAENPMKYNFYYHFTKEETEDDREDANRPAIYTCPLCVCVCN